MDKDKLKESIAFKLMFYTIMFGMPDEFCLFICKKVIKKNKKYFYKREFVEMAFLYVEYYDGELLTKTEYLESFLRRI